MAYNNGGFRTIVAQFDGVCKRCGGAIKAGQSIRYGGRGRTYHLKAECVTQTADTGHAPDVDRQQESESEAWARRAEEGWGPGGY
jgi:hypothetical protein